MNELLKKDTNIKIWALIIAIFLWLYVYNTSNPFITTTFTNIPLKIANENYLVKNGYVLINDIKVNVDITVRGRQNTINKIAEQDFTATVDLSQIKSENDKSLKIAQPICDLKDVVIESYSPKTVEIQLIK